MNVQIKKYENTLIDICTNEPSINLAAWIGSMAHGGFSVNFSDLDVFFIFNNQIEDEVIQEKILNWKLDTNLGDRLSVFWCRPDFKPGRLPTPDKIDFIDNGIVIYGEAPRNISRPTPDDLRDYIHKQSLPYWTSLIEEIGQRTHEKTLIRCSLYPARLFYSWKTGKISSNEDAVQYCLKNNWVGDNELIVESARARLVGGIEKRKIFNRKRIQTQFQSVVSHLLDK